MARVAFQYRASTPAGRWDIRWRVVSVTVFSAAVLASPAWGLVFLAVSLVPGLAAARVKPGDLGRLALSLAPYFAFFAGVGLLLTPTTGQAALLGLQSARLALLFLASHFLLVTATPQTVARGIQWFLRPLGARRAWLGASMASWALAAVPRLVDQGKGLLEAAALRGLRPARRPLATVKLVTLGLLVRVVQQASITADALETRGFGTHVPKHGLVARPSDVLWFLLWTAVCATAMLMP
ncbi:MAG: energy-coupling factor transporter transmembrane component T [Spirochaetales bacterium]